MGRGWGGVTKEFIDNVQRIGNNRITLAFEDNLSEQSLETQQRGGGGEGEEHRGTRSWKR